MSMMQLGLMDNRAAANPDNRIVIALKKGLTYDPTFPLARRFSAQET